jgi:hypothetical protein
MTDREIVEVGIDIEKRRTGKEKLHENIIRKIESEDYRGAIAELIELLQVKEAIAIAERPYSLIEEEVAE